MRTPLIQLLTPGTVLLAAGARLSRHLAQRYARECRSLGMDVWETPTILTFNAWLAGLWQEAVELGVDQRLLLASAQQEALWERALRESEHDTQLLPPAATARLAQEAWMLLHAWHLPQAELKKVGHEDVQIFLGWSAAFNELCRAHGWIDSARLIDALADLIIAKRIPVPARIVLSGFDEFTPQQNRLFDALRGADCDVTMLSSAQDIAARAVRIGFVSPEEELLAAARWARERLATDPSCRVGILAPDLNMANRAIRRVFDDVLLPQSVLPGHAELARPYNVSLGESLASQQLVETALTILEFATDDIASAKLSALLRSPYIAGSDVERSRRALLDVELRRTADAHVGTDVLARVLERSQDKVYACPILASRLQGFRTLRDRLSTRYSCAQWLDHFAQLLAAMGWPGDRQRSSTEYQVVEKWRELLGGFGALGSVLPPLSYFEALSRLRRLAQETLFQRETPETPVQILGILESSGFEFDALWVLGLHDEVWPSPARPSPFLPVALQRARRLPHSSAERELEFCARQTQRLLHSAPQAVVSFPLRQEDRDLRASPLISSLPTADLNAVVGETLPRYRDIIRASSNLQTLTDTQAPPVPPATPVAGGTALFKAQSACPFRAFAEFRIGAKQLPESEPGLSPADRGTLVHQVFGRLWHSIGSHAALVALSAEALTERVRTLVADEVRQFQARRPRTLTQRVFDLECERLVALALEWMALERMRAPFVVRSEEEKVVLSIAGLTTPTRVDRVDELSDGQLAIIDYKTGEAEIRGWFGERPAEPQLPLYALYAAPRERVAALVYGKLRRGDVGFSGITRVDGALPGIPLFGETKLAARGSWADLFQEWELNLSALAREFVNGNAAVSPRERQVCERCHLHAFCRVYERRARLAAAEGDNGE